MLLLIIVSKLFYFIFEGDTGIRYAMSGDVTVDEESFLQFEVAMGCVSNRECYSKFFFFKYFSTLTRNLQL